MLSVIKETPELQTFLESYFYCLELRERFLWSNYLQTPVEQECNEILAANFYKKSKIYIVVSLLDDTPIERLCPNLGTLKIQKRFMCQSDLIRMIFLDI